MESMYSMLVTLNYVQNKTLISEWRSTFTKIYLIRHKFNFILFFVPINYRLFTILKVFLYLVYIGDFLENAALHVTQCSITNIYQVNIIWKQAFYLYLSGYWLTL